MKIEGYTFEIDKQVRMLILRDPIQCVRFKTPRNSMTTRTIDVFLIPAFLYDDVQRGASGRIVILVEGSRKDKFLHTLADTYQNLRSDLIEKDIIVNYERYKSENSPTGYRRRFTISELPNRLIENRDVVQTQIPTEEEMIRIAREVLLEREKKILEVQRAYRVSENMLDLIDPTYS